jgi:hypothetical protein
VSGHWIFTPGLNALMTDGLSAGLLRWKRAYRKDYKHAFVSLGLPQVLEPFVRLDMAGWDPIHSSAEGELAWRAPEIWTFPFFGGPTLPPHPCRGGDGPVRVVPAALQLRSG